VSRVKVYEAFANIGFVLLFPGFVLYHDLVARQVLPRILGGFFSWVSLILVAGLAVPSMNRLAIAAIRGDNFSRLLIALYCYLLLVIFWHWSFIFSEVQAATVYQAANSLLAWIALTSVGLWISLYNKWIRNVIWLSFLASTALLLLYVLTTGSVMYFAASFSGVEGIASYQGYARTALIGLLFLVAISKTGLQRISVYLGGFFILFLLGARSELLSFLVAVPIYFAIASRRSPRIIMIIIISAFALTAVVSSNWDWFILSRQSQVLNLHESTSWRARQDLLAEAWQIVLDSPVLGDFGGHVRFDESTGAYAHNILSGWVSYGFLGFILILSISIWATAGSGFLLFRESTSDNDISFAFLLNATTLLLLLVSKSIFWVVPGLAWGFYFAASTKLMRKRRYL